MSGSNGSARGFLAREIRRAREAKGINRPTLAKELFVSESLIKMWETSRRVPTADDTAKLDELFGMNGVLVRFREEVVKTSVPVEWFGRWAEIESRATSLWTFQPSLIPGLLQTEDYARTILRAANHLADVEEMVSARMERQLILAREDEEPPMFVTILAESALRHNVGGPKVMVEQLAHLVDVVERVGKIIVQVIPDIAPACAGFLSGFVIATFDGGDVAYVDNQLTGDVIEDTDDVTRLRHTFDNFRADALSRQESAALIAKEIERWNLH